MTKEDLSKALSLSCVENYFLAYFKDYFDVRTVYVESFAPFNMVMKDYLADKASYENYPLARVQDTGEKIGLTKHKLTENFQIEENCLTLIRVNEKFFENSKLTPWRVDHYISISKVNKNICFFNNYPLSNGDMPIDGLNKIYDGSCLNYSLVNRLDCEMFNRLANMQFNSILHDDVKSFTINEQNIMQLRNAILTLKIIRKRLILWLEYMSERGEFLMDVKFKDFMELLLQSYDKFFVTIELQFARRKVDINILQDKLDGLVEFENKFIKEVKFRRLENEYI